MADQKNMQKFGAKLMDEDITKDDLKSTGFLRSDVLYWTIKVLKIKLIYNQSVHPNQFSGFQLD